MQLRIRCPDDWHLHLRDGAALSELVRHSARQFARAIVMPNLDPPILSTADALNYRRRILEALPAKMRFDPLMTLYLTDDTDPDEITAARASGAVFAVKLYPAGATTHSARGVTDIGRIDAVLDRMAEIGMPLLVHGEVVDPVVDVFDRERVFIDDVLQPLIRRNPRLRVVMEHITTREAVAFVEASGPAVAATITVHHLRFNRNAMFQGGLRPHHYCLPPLKRECHRQALVAAATSGNPKFFLGTDSAPHRREAKESACGCAGIFSAHAALEMYAEVFEEADSLDKLEGFASDHGAGFYGLPPNDESILLVRERWRVPSMLPLGDGQIQPLAAGEELQWRLAD